MSGLELIDQKQIQQACDALGIKNPLIVTDPGYYKHPIIDEINSNLSSNNKCLF